LFVPISNIVSSILLKPPRPSWLQREPLR